MNKHKHVKDSEANFRILKKLAKRTVSFGAALTIGLVPFISNIDSAHADVPTEKPNVDNNPGAAITTTDPSGRLTLTLNKTYDGTGHGDSVKECLVNSKNGYQIGDNAPLDGVVCSGDELGFKMSYSIKPSDKESKIELKMRSLIEMTDNSSLPNNNLYLADYYNKICKDKVLPNVSASLRDDSCILTIPASNESVAGSFDFKQGIGQEFAQGYTKIQFGLSNVGAFIDDRYVDSRKTLIVTANSIDPWIVRTKAEPVFEIIDGVPGYTIPYQIRIAQSYYWIKGSMVRDMHADTDVKVELSGFPDDAKIIRNDSKVSQLGNTISYSGSASLRDNNGISHYYNDDSQPKFTMFIPASEVPSNIEQSYTARISGFTINNVSRNGKTYDMNSWYYINQYAHEGSGVEAGFGKPVDFSTELYYGSNFNTITYQGDVAGQGAKNNDWSVTKFTQKSGIGSNTPVEVYDVDGKPSLKNNGEPDKAFSFYEDPVSLNQDYWLQNRFSVKSGSVNNPAVCNVIPINQTKFSVSKNIIAKWQDGNGQLVDASAKVLYGHSTDGSSSWEKVGMDYINDDTDNRMRSLCNDTSSISWSETPREGDDIVKVVFDGEKNFAFADAVNAGYVAVPMEHYKNDINIHYTNSPDLTNISSAAMLGYSDTSDSITNWVKKAKINHYVGLPWYNPMVSGETSNGLIFAGAENTVASNPAEINYSSKNVYEKANVEDLRDHYDGSVTWEFNTCVSTLTVPEDLKKTWNYSVKSADFGPDELACTSDDVSGWVVTGTPKPDNPIKISTNPTDYREFLKSYNWNITVPAWAKSTTPVTVTTTLKPTSYMTMLNWQKTYSKTFTRTYNIQQNETIAQSLTTTDQNVFASSDVHWKMNILNNTKSQTSSGEFLTVLPYNNDSRGSKLSKPLSNVQVSGNSNNSDVKIYVTSSAPENIKTVNDATWCELSDKACLGGKEITAVRVFDDNLDPNELITVEISANTSGNKDGDVLFANLSKAVVSGYNVDVPETTSMKSNIFESVASGYIWRDNNKNGILDEAEKTRYANQDFFITDDTGENVLASGTTDSNGYYEVKGLPEGEYGVFLDGRSSDVPDDYGMTTDEFLPFTISKESPNAKNLDFGYYAPGSLTLSKTAPDVTGSHVVSGSSVTWNYTVDNVGDDPVNNIVVSDNKGVVVTCPKDILESNETMVCTGTGIVTAD